MTGDTGGRRERRKAQTRAEVREAAQRLFAERGFDAVTIADVAAAAEVAVQTVFNHFETKEALFFDGRTPWVERAVAAVTERAPDRDPISALRDYLETDLIEILGRESRPENRGYLEALRASPSLQARERTLVEETGQRVAAALVSAIAEGDRTTTDDATAEVLSQLVADLFLMAGRVLVLENRRLLLGPEPAAAHQLQRTTVLTLSALEQCVRGLAGRMLDPPG